MQKYEGYTIGRDGQVWSHKTNKYLTWSIGKDGYARVPIHFGKRNSVKLIFVHRLVAETYLENVNNYPVVNHKDKNKLNNCVDNLEWCTLSYNAIHSHGVKCRCKETGEVFETMSAAALALGVSETTIHRWIKSNKDKYPIELIK